VEELQEGLCERQRAYLEFVLASAEDVVLDMTRCHYKVEALHEIAPDAYLLHLYRPAAAWVTSHLGARASGWRGRVRSFVDRATFFERRHRYNYWGIEHVVANSPETLFGRRLGEAELRLPRPSPCGSGGAPPGGCPGGFLLATLSIFTAARAPPGPLALMLRCIASA